MSYQRKQRTLKRAVKASGIGLFTGEEVTICLSPADEERGVRFKRVDLPGQPEIVAVADQVQRTSRCTLLGNAYASVQTVEHLLAAFSAYGLDNVLVEISGSEVPIFDGSSKHFVELIEEAGICNQEKDKEIFRLQRPLFWSQRGTQIVALPAEEYKISYLLHYPDAPIIGTQFYTFSVNPHSFKEEIAPCRTFSVYEEIAPMIEKGLVKGGSLDNAVIVKEGVVINSEGLRYPNEMVRHKVLDLIGDLFLVPPFLAHVIAICSGHAANNAFAKQLLEEIRQASTVSDSLLNCITVENLR